MIRFLATILFCLQAVVCYGQTSIQNLPAAQSLSPADLFIVDQLIAPSVRRTGQVPLSGMGLFFNTCQGNAGTVTPSTCVSGGVDQNVLNNQIANYTPVSADCGKTIQAGVGSTGLFTITLPSVSGFPTNCSLLIKNGDATRGKKLVGFPGEVPTVLWPLQSVGVKIVNGVWSSFYLPGRWQIGVFGGAHFYIDQSLGSNTNDGLAPGAGAFQSFNSGIVTILNSLDSQTQNIFVHLASGQSWSNFILDGSLLGGGLVYIDLNGNNLNGTSSGQAAAMYVNGGNNSTILVTLYSAVPGATITCTTGTYGMVVVSGDAGISAVGGSNSNISMGACPNGTHFWADSPYGRIIALGNYGITGGAQHHWVAANGGHADFDSSITVTCTGTPAFTGGAFNPAFAYAYNQGMVVNNETFSGCGGVTGIKYAAYLSGSIVGANTLPGNAAGFISSGGVVDAPGIPTASCTGSAATPTVSGTDTSGRILEGTGSTGCTITFTTNNQPFACTAATTSATANAAIAVAVTATELTVAHASVDNQFLYYTCPPQGN